MISYYTTDLFIEPKIGKILKEDQQSIIGPLFIKTAKFYNNYYLPVHYAPHYTGPFQNFYPMAEAACSESGYDKLYNQAFSCPNLNCNYYK